MTTDEDAEAQQLWAMSSFAGTFTMIEHAVLMLDENQFDDREIKAFGLYPQHTQFRLRARLLELFEALREAVVAFDERLQQLEAA